MGVLSRRIKDSRDSQVRDRVRDDEQWFLGEVWRNNQGRMISDGVDGELGIVAFGSNTWRWVTKCNFMRDLNFRRSLVLHIMEEYKRVLLSTESAYFAFLQMRDLFILGQDSALNFMLRDGSSSTAVVHHLSVSRNPAVIDVRRRRKRRRGTYFRRKNSTHLFSLTVPRKTSFRNVAPAPSLRDTSWCDPKMKDFIII